MSVIFLSGSDSARPSTVSLAYAVRRSAEQMVAVAITKRDTEYKQRAHQVLNAGRWGGKSRAIGGVRERGVMSCIAVGAMDEWSRGWVLTVGIHAAALARIMIVKDLVLNTSVRTGW